MEMSVKIYSTDEEPLQEIRGPRNVSLKDEQDSSVIFLYEVYP